MAMCMKARGETIKQQARESTLTQTGLTTTGSGWTTSNMVMGQKYGQMGLGIREITLGERNTERVILSGLMGRTILEILRITIFMEEEFTAGRMEDDLMGTG